MHQERNIQARDSQDGIDQTQVVIIGAGIAGPALALFLRQVGFAPVIYEAYGPDSEAGGGFQIAPNGMHVLAELGLAEALLAESMPADWIQFETAQGRRLARFENGPAASYGIAGVVASRAVLQRLLKQALADQGIPVQYHKRLAGLSQDAEGLSLHFGDGSSARAELLIGADGIHSPTRACLFADAPGPVFTGQLNIGGFANLSHGLDLEGTTHMVFGPGHFIGYSRVDQRDPRRYMWWCNLPAAQAWDRQALAAQSPETFRAELLAQCRDWAAPIPALIGQSEGLVRTNTLTLPPLPAWSSGRAVLIGDAAHGLDPASGQGASLALEDALCLAKLLRERWQDPTARIPAPALEQALIRFERERRPRIDTIALSARRRASSKGKLGPVGLWLRDLMMSKLVPGLAVKEQRQLFSYRLSWC